MHQLDFVIHAEAGGFRDVVARPRVTVKLSDMPWNELFENVLASNGLGFVIEQKLLYIAPVEDLASIERVRGRTYFGTSINLNFLAGRLEDMLGLFSDITGFRLVPDANLKTGECPPPPSPCSSAPWYLTLRVSERPSMQVLDHSPDGQPLACRPALGNVMYFRNRA